MPGVHVYMQGLVLVQCCLQRGLQLLATRAPCPHTHGRLGAGVCHVIHAGSPPLAPKPHMHMHTHATACSPCGRQSPHSSARDGAVGIVVVLIDSGSTVGVRNGDVHCGLNHGAPAGSHAVSCWAPKQGPLTGTEQRASRPRAATSPIDCAWSQRLRLASLQL